MPTVAHVAESRAFDAHEAATTATEQALGGLGGPADLLLVFAATGYDQQTVIDAVRLAAPDVAVSGCSAEGVIAGRDSHETDRVVAVMALRSTNMRFEVFLRPGYGDDAARCGSEIAALASATDEPIVGVIVFPDGLMGDASALLGALGDALPNVPVAGGNAADAMTLEQTYQYADGEVTSGAVSGVVIRGEGSLRVAVSHGCQRLGLPRTITRTEGGWLHELDGQPAWDVFKEYLDGEPTSLSVEGIPHLCLGLPVPVEAEEEHTQFVVRTPMNLDPETGALFFPGGGLETGARVHMTRRNPSTIRTTAAACADRVVADREDAPAVVLQFDCCGRGKILFGMEVAQEIIHPLQERIGDVPWLGMHSFGEIASLAGRPAFHNYTVALCALYDEPTATP